MLKADIIINDKLIMTFKADDLDPLLYKVAQWCDQVLYVGRGDKLNIKVCHFDEEDEKDEI